MRESRWERKERQKDNDRHIEREFNGTGFVLEKINLQRINGCEDGEWVQAHLAMWVDAFEFLKSSSSIGMEEREQGGGGGGTGI